MPDRLATIKGLPGLLVRNNRVAVEPLGDL